MWYTIKHICGHTEEVQLFGKNADRESKIKWLESQPCAECRAKSDDDLKGSVKQIAWAGDIRKEMRKDFDAWCAKQLDQTPEGKMELAQTNIETAKAELESIKDARWFIDNRDARGASLYRALGRHYSDRTAA